MILDEPIQIRVNLRDNSYKISGVMTLPLGQTAQGLLIVHREHIAGYGGLIIPTTSGAELIMKEEIKSVEVIYVKAVKPKPRAVVDIKTKEEVKE